MSKALYLVRHCQSVGPHPDAPLSREGLVQANALTDRLTDLQIERIVSSLWARAIQSITPLAERLRLAIETDPRLTEQILSGADLPDWQGALRATFDDLDLRFEGGESSRTAMQRVVAAVEEIRTHVARVTAVVTHGKLLTLLLKHFDPRVGFADWQALTNPDIFRLTFAPDRVAVQRVPWRPA